MSDTKNNSGFVWGLLIGAAIGSLLSTEKGRRIIKELSEHGIESIENLMDIDEIKDALGESGTLSQNKVREGVVVEKSPKKPRLFKGIKKK